MFEDKKVDLKPALGVEGAEQAYGWLVDAIKKYTQIKDLSRIESAYKFAFDAHKNQLRKDGTMYITHPLKAAEIVAEMGLDEDSIVAAILHDTIEDTDVTHEDIAKKFGSEVADIVEGVTKLTRVVYTSKEDEQMENLRKMFVAMAKDIRVIIIKIADRIHNLRTMDYQTESKQREKTLETMEMYAPLAHRLGMNKAKVEMEDLSLRYLDPVGYQEIVEGVKDRGGKYENFMVNTEAQIKKRMAEVGVECTVQSRIKDVYSIYRKMYTQNKQLSEIMDLYAFRVIVNDISDCYNVLGCIHDLYRPIPGRFKDYIGTPKPNMYQSLHTTVIGSEGIPFEVQIRTWEMHRTAEYGVAAHWKYKQGVSSTSDEEKFAWIRNLLESQQEADSQDFLSSLKFDMFADEVFVFTPNGDVKSLPAGSTPIDFAYNIHSAVGNSMTCAKVNGRIVPFNHQLQNGDVVEIITSSTSKGPSRDWLSVVKSSEARNKIRAWFKKEKREENIVQGKSAFEAELRRQGLPLSVVNNSEVMSVILKRVTCATIEDLYSAIGYGGLSAQKTVNRIKDELRVIEKNNKSGDTPDWVVSEKHAKPVHGIIVQGIDNCLVKFSHCCMPVPGDGIIGFITRGYGVSIHRCDCKNYLSSASKEENKNRWISVAWAKDTDEKYQTGIAITANDRDGLVVDIATVLTSLKIKVDSLSAREMGGGQAIIYITIEVKDKEELGVAMARIMSVKSVREVKRQGT